jgi:hypothetical protein
MPQRCARSLLLLALLLPLQHNMVCAQFNLGGGFSSDKCTMASFTARVKEIDEACCKGKGADVCPLGTPIRCDLECGLEYLPFFEECQNLIMGLSSAPQKVVVMVGPSGSSTKTITAENLISCKAGKGTNAQNPAWRDTFSGTVSSDHMKLTVSLLI